MEIKLREIRERVMIAKRQGLFTDDDIYGDAGYLLDTIHHAHAEIKRKLELTNKLRHQLKAEQDKNIWHLNALKGVLARLKAREDSEGIVEDIERYIDDLKENNND